MWVRWPLQPLQPLQKTQLQPPCGPSVGSLCHPCITTTHISYSVLSLKLPPPPCAVLLHGNILIIIIITTITTITITITILYVCLSIYISMLCSKFLAWIGTHTHIYLYVYIWNSFGTWLLQRTPHKITYGQRRSYPQQPKAKVQERQSEEFQRFASRHVFLRI